MHDGIGHMTPPRQNLLPPPTVTAQAVRILLECILVKLRSEPNLFFGENKLQDVTLSQVELFERQ